MNEIILYVSIKTKNISDFKNELKNGIIHDVIEIRSDSNGKGIVMFVIECEEKYKKEILDSGFKYFRNEEENNEQR